MYEFENVWHECIWGGWQEDSKSSSGRGCCVVEDSRKAARARAHWSQWLVGYYIAWNYKEEGSHSTSWTPALHDRDLHEVIVDENWNQSWNKSLGYLRVSNAHTLPVCDEKCCNTMKSIRDLQGLRLDVLFTPPTFERRLASTQEGGFDKFAPRFALTWPRLSSHLWKFRLLVKKIFCSQLIVLKYYWGGVSRRFADQILPFMGWQIASNLSSKMMMKELQHLSLGWSW